MKNNLIPTLVVDKNGRYTTVYRKLPTTLDVAGEIPSPAKEAWAARQMKQRGIIMLVNQSFALTVDKVEAVKETLVGYSDDSINVVLDALHDENLTTPISHLLYDDKNEQEVGEAIRFLPHCDITGFTGSLSLIRTLHGHHADTGKRFYEGLPEADNYSRADEKVQLQCESLIRVSCAIRNCSPEWYEWMTLVEMEDNDSAMIIKDERLISLALERYDAVDVIEETINHRENADYEMISSVLENALGQGNL